MMGECAGGVGFETGKAPVYTKEEHATMKESAAKVKQAPDPFDTWFKGVPAEEAKRRAKMVGIDLDNPKTRKALEAKARKHQEMDLQRKAKVRVKPNVPTLP